MQLLLKLRHVLAKLCPETDGLQWRFRIKVELRGTTPGERRESLLDYVYGECPLVPDGELTYHTARLVSQVYSFEGFTPEAVYRLLVKSL